MKRIETLIQFAIADLEAKEHAYVGFERNGVQALELARAVDQIRAAERILRRAYEGRS